MTPGVPYKAARFQGKDNGDTLHQKLYFLSPGTLLRNSKNIKYISSFNKHFGMNMAFHVKSNILSYFRELQDHVLQLLEYHANFMNIKKS